MSWFCAGRSTPHLSHVTMRHSVCPFRLSIAFTYRIAYCFLFLRVLRCFNSPGSLPSRVDSGTFGSMAACASPKIITACHALHQHSNQAIPCMVKSSASLCRQRDAELLRLLVLVDLTSRVSLMLTSPTYQTILLMVSMLSIFGVGFKLRCFQLLPIMA